MGNHNALQCSTTLRTVLCTPVPFTKYVRKCIFIHSLPGHILGFEPAYRWPGTGKFIPNPSVSIPNLAVFITNSDYADLVIILPCMVYEIVALGETP